MHLAFIEFVVISGTTWKTSTYYLCNSQFRRRKNQFIVNNFVPCLVRVRNKMRVVILIKFVFCFTESFVPPWTRIQDMIGNTVKENIDDIKYDILDDHMLG